MFFTQDHDHQSLWLDGEEWQHCVQSLRKKLGDNIQVFNAQGQAWDAQIDLLEKKRLRAKILRPLDFPKRWTSQIHLGIAPTKNMDRLEWLVEKAVEMGIDRISPLICQRSERRQLRLDRLEKIALSAAKQSLNIALPQLDEAQTLNSFLPQVQASQKLIAHCIEQYPKTSLLSLPQAPSYCLLIGPEGDFSPEEVQLAQSLGFQGISLGPSRLRTETAGLMGLAWLHAKAGS